MPGRDGTGPMGLGKISGRGFCYSDINMKSCTYGLGRGCRQGYNNNLIPNSYNSESKKEFLTQQKNVLENKLASVNEMLDIL